MKHWRRIIKNKILSFPVWAGGVFFVAVVLFGLRMVFAGNDTKTMYIFPTKVNSVGWENEEKSFEQNLSGEAIFSDFNSDNSGHILKEAEVLPAGAGDAVSGDEIPEEPLLPETKTDEAENSSAKKTDENVSGDGEDSRPLEAQTVSTPVPESPSQAPAEQAPAKSIPAEGENSGSIQSLFEKILTPLFAEELMASETTTPAVAETASSSNDGAPAAKNSPADVPTESDDQDTAVCTIKGKECHTMELSGFDIAGGETFGEIKNVQLRLSLGAKGEEGVSESDRLFLKYFYKGEWYLADAIVLNKEISNAINGGHFLYAMPDIKNWEELSKIKVSLEYDRNSNTKTEVFVDSVWVDVAFTSPDEEEVTPKGNVAFDLNTEDVSNNPDILAVSADEEILFDYSGDVNSNGFLIKTDKFRYNGLSGRKVHFSVTNTTDTESTFDLNMYFPENGGEIRSLKKWTRNVPYEMNVSEYKPLTYFCEGGWKRAEVAEGEVAAVPPEYSCPLSGDVQLCNELNSDQVNCTVQNTKIGVRKETKYKDDWKDVVIGENRKENKLQDELQKIVGYFQGPKYNVIVPERTKEIWEGEHLIFPDQTLYFEMDVSHPINSRGRFYIKASDKNSVALIGPRWDGGWKYRIPITADNAKNKNAPALNETYMEIDETVSDFWKNAKEDGSDIRFASDAGTEFPYRISSWDGEKRKTGIWVSLPEIPSDSKNTFYLYYGNEKAASESRAYRASAHSELRDIPDSAVSFSFGGEESSPVFPDVADVNMKIDILDETVVAVKEVKDENKKAEFKTPKINDVVGERKDFNAKDRPEFRFRYKPQRNVFVKLFREIFAKRQFFVKNISLSDSGGNDVSADFDVAYEENDEWFIKMENQPKNFRPGKYTLKIEVDEGGVIFSDEMNFYWGVLAVNTNKAVFVSGEEAYLQMAALADNGDTICNASLVLTITSPDGIAREIPVEAQSSCGLNNVTDNPDYTAYYGVKAPGVYKMNLLHEGNDGVPINNTEDSFEVRESVPFVIERTGATRIWPKSSYVMKLSVTSVHDFKGQFTETVPKNFELLSLGGGDTDLWGNAKHIVWNVDFKAGETKTFSYEYDAPDISPYLYTLGPADMRAGSGLPFTETRTWKLASDATGNMLLLWDTAAYIPDGWTCVSCASGDPFYQRFVIGSSTPNLTGGSGTHTHAATGAVNPSAGTTNVDTNNQATPVVAHTHTYTPTISTASNLPTYRNLVVIQYSSTGQPTNIPTGAIAIFDASVPSGWTRYSAQDNYFTYGESAANIGGNGGSATHSHTITGNTGNSATTALIRNPGTTVSVAATHNHSVNGNTSTETIFPPYISVILGKLDATSTPPNNMIAMWTDTPDAGWDSVSGSGGDFENRFLYGSATYGTTGGVATSTHPDVAGIVSGTPGTVVNRDSTPATRTIASALHTHLVDVTNFNTVWSLPPYRTAIFAKRAGGTPAATSTFYNIPFDNEKNASSTPALEFRSDDPDGSDDLLYQLQWDDDADVAVSPLGDCTSDVSCSPHTFQNLATPGDTSPFNDNERMRFRIQTALQNGTTYYWRVRAKDSGAAWGAWSTVQSFTYDQSASGVSKWHQTEDAQFDQGTYSGTAATYGTNDVQIDTSITGAMVAYAEGTVTTPKYRLWDGSAWGAQGDAVDVGERLDWVRTSAATTRNEYIMATMGASGKVMAQIYDGNTVAWGNATTTVTTSASISYRGFDVAYESTSGDAMVASCSGNDAVYQKWNGTSWTYPTTITEVSLGAACQWLQLASDPTSNEIIMIMRSDVSATTDYEAIVWSGSEWGNILDLGNSVANNLEGMAAAYEESGTDAVVTFGNGGGNNFISSRWDGATWNNLSNTAIGDNFEKGQLKRDLGTDNIMLTYSDMDLDMGYAEWNGTTNSWSASSELFTNAVFHYTNSIASEYETTAGRDGYGMFVYGQNTSLTERYRVLDRTTPVTAEADLSTILESSSAFTARTGDGIILGVFFDNDNDRYDFSYWDAANWSSRQAIETDANTQATLTEPFAVSAQRSASGAGTILSPIIDFDSIPSRTEWGEATWNTTEPSGTDIKVQVYYDATCSTIIPDGDLSGNSAGFDATASPLNLSGLSIVTYNQICLKASLTSTSPESPSLDDWTVSWERESYLTQTSFRWYVNDAASLTPSDAWPSGDEFVDEGEKIPFNYAPASGDVLRLRIAVKDTNAALSAGSADFTLEWAEGSVCSAGLTFADVGAPGSSEPWRGYDNASLSDGATLPGRVLGTTDTSETYEEENDTASNPNGIAVDDEGEWDFTIQHNATSSTDYCFRLKNSDGTALDAYDDYPALVTNAPPSAPVLSIPFTFERLASTTPWFEFVSEDSKGEEIQYEVQVDDDIAFGSPSLDRNSDTNWTEFENQITPSDKNPFNNAQLIRFIPTSALSSGTTYWWRVRAKDPNGSDDWGSWSESRSFTVTSGITITTWHQTTLDQFDLNTNETTETSGDALMLTAPNTTGTSTSPAIQYDWKTTGTSWGELAWASTTPSGSTLKLHIEYYDSGTGLWALIPDSVIPGNAAGLTETTSLLAVDTTIYNTIRTYAVFYDGGGGTPYLNDWTISWGLAVEKSIQIALFDNEKTGTTTPTFRFYSTDPQGNDLQYQIEWAASPTFSAPTTRTSGTDNGFANVASSTDTSPFAEGDTIRFTTQFADAFTNGNTYWWRVRARDPVPGDNVWSVWSVSRSFTVDTSVAVSTWFQTTDDQWAIDNLNDTETYGAGNVRLTSLIREALVAYGEGTTAMPKYRLWNGTEWGVEKSADTIGERVQWVKTDAAPTRGEYVMATMGQSGKVMAQIYNDTTETWGNATTTVTASSNILYRGYDVAYETTSGDAMVVSCSGMDAVYQKWNGSVWTPPTAIALSLTANCQWLQLASDPTSNEIILLAKSDIAAAVDYEAVVWNGTDTWANSVTVGVGSNNAYEAMAVAYEESGTDAVVVIQNSTNNSFLSRRWSGSAPWVDAGTVAIGNDLNKAQLKRDLGSDRIMLTFTNANTDVGYAEWTGSSNSWSASSILFANAVTRYTNSIASEYETTSGRDGYVMFAYGDNTNLTERYQVLDRVTPVTAQQNLSTISESVSVFTTRTGDGTILGVFFDDDNDRYDVSSWDGSLWSARQAIETNANTLANRPEPLSIVARRYASITSGSVVGSAIEYSDGDGPRWGSLSWNDTTTGGSDIKYQLEYYSTSTDEWALVPDADLPYNSVGTSTGPVILTSLNRTTYGMIRPVANFSCGASCPTLSDWTVAWDAGVTVNGTAKQYDESTNVTSGTVAVAINGTLQFGKTADIGAGGTWTMTNVNAVADDILTFFIDGAADSAEAVAVAKYDGTGTMDGVNLFERHLSVGSEDNQIFSNAELGAYDNSVSLNENIFHTVDAGNDLSACGIAGCSDVKLYIKIGNTYRPDSASSGNITTHDMVIKGSLNADANTIYVSGSWTNNGSFTASAGAVMTTASVGTETIDNTDATSYDFYNLTLGQTSGTATWNLLSALVVSNDLAVTYGTLNQNGANTIHIGGNLTIGTAGGWTKGTSDVTFNGTGSKMWTDSTVAKQDLGSVVIDGTLKTVLLGSSVKATDITIGADDTLDVNNNAYNMEVTGDWLNGNVFTARQATVTFSTTTSGHTIFPAGSPFYNLIFVGAGGGWQFDTAEATTTNNFTITSGAVTLPNNILSVGGSFNNNGGTFSHNGGTVKLVATVSGKTVKGGGSDFANLLFNGISGVWTMSDTNATTTNDFTISAGGVTLPTGVLAIGGSFTRPGGTFTHSSGTVKMTATTGSKSVTPGTSNFYNLTFAGTDGGWTITTASPTIANNFSISAGAVTLPTGTLTVTGSFTVTGGTFAHSNGTVLMNSGATEKTINPGGSPFYTLTLNNVAGGWTITGNASTTNNFNLTAANTFIQSPGTTLEVRGTFTNGIAGANTTWTDSTLYLNSGTSYSMNTKVLGGDEYGTLQIGANTDVKMWNSSASAYAVDSSGSLYSQKHNAASGDLYIWGDYNRSSGTEYWNYATDFDGTALGGSSRIANIRFASDSSATFTAGTLQVLGTASASTTIDNQGSGNYAVNVTGGTLNAQYYQFRNLNASGLNISGTPTVTSLSDGDFEIAVSDGTGISVASSTIGLAANNLKQIWNVRFATTTAISATNVTETGTATSNWWFRNSYGNLTGEVFDVDPGPNFGNPGYVKWDDSGYTISVSGTVYSGEATGPDAVNCPNVRVSVNGVLSPSAAVCVGAAYTVSDVAFNGDAVLTIFIDGGTARGVTVTKTPTGDLTGADIYENRVIVRHEDVTAMTIANMEMYDSSDDSDIPFTATDASPDTLALPPDTELHVWDGKTFTPGGNITLESGGSGNIYDARLHIGNNSVFTATDSESHSLGGNFQKDAGSTFTAANSDFTFTATTTGKIIIGVAAPTFYNLIFNGDGGNWSLNSAVNVSGNLTPTAGTISGTGSVTVTGANVAGDGVFNMTGGTVTLSAGGNFGGANDWKFYGLTLGGASATTTKIGANNIEIANNLTISANHGLDAGNDVWTITGAGNAFTKTGYFNSDTSLFKYATTSATNITAASYYRLELSPAGAGTPTYTLKTGNLTVSDTLTIGNGTNPVSVTATAEDPNIIVGGNFLISPNAAFIGSNASSIFYIGGNYTNQGTFTHGNSTVTMNADTAGKTITAGSSSFYNLIFNNASGGWTITGNATTTNNFTLSAASSFTQTAGTTLEVKGIFTNSIGGAATVWDGTALYLNSGTSYSMNEKSSGGDTYDTLSVGAGTNVKMWNSTSTIYSISASGSLSSQDHDSVDGSLFIFGAYPHSSGADYWSYATDFDGADISGSPRRANVRFASGASATFSGGTLEMLGTAGSTTTVDVQDSGNYSMNVSGGTLNAQYYQFRNLDANGLNMSGTPTVTTLSDGDFELAVNSGTTMTVAASVITANPLKTFTRMRFATTTAIAGWNVTAVGSTVEGWRFNNHVGDLSGETFDVDPGGNPGYLAWDDSDGAITVSGYVYSDEGTIVSTVCDDSTPVVRLLVAGVGARTAPCDGSGFYTFANVAYNPLDVITIYLNDTDERAATIIADPVTNISDANVYENRVIVRHQDIFPITIADMAGYDSSDDADIPFTAADASPDTLVVAPETELHVWKGKTFTPGGNVTLQSGGSGNIWDGRLHIDGDGASGASFVATGSESHSVGGSFSVDNASTFTAANSTLTFTATTTGKTIASVTDPLIFASTTFNGAGGGWTFSNTEATTTSNFTITNGSVTLPTGTFSVGGSFANNGGTFSNSNGVVKLTATAGGKTVKGGGSDFYNLLFNGTGGGWTMSDTNATTTNDFTIEAGTVTAPSGTLSVGGSFQKTGGTFTHNGGTVKFTAVSAGKVIFPGNSSFATLLFNGAGGEWAFTTADATSTATTTIANGTVTLPSGVFAVGGGFVNSDAFIHNGGTVKMNATATGKFITAGSSLFNNLIFNGTGGGWTITDNATTTGNFTLTTATSFTQTSGTTLEVDGIFTQGIAGANTTWTGSTLYLSTTTPYSINTKALGGDTYNILKIGASTDVKMWNSSASTYTVDASGSLYSMKHAAASGDLYVFGDYHSSGSEYWSYAKDFDGVATARTANVKFASGAAITFSSGTFEIIGDATHVTNINNQSSGSYSFNISGGTLNASYYQFKNADSNGLNFSGNPTVTSLSNGDFELDNSGGSMITIPGGVIDQNAGLQISTVNFATSTGVSSGYNVTRTGSTLNAWTFLASTGNYDGEEYDSDGADACGAIRWNDSECLFLDQSHYRWRADDGGEGVPDDSWYDGNWAKRKKIRLTNNTASDLSDFQMKVDVTWDSDMQSDFDDLRFTDETGTTSISYFIESYISAATSTVWLKVPSIPASASSDVYLYYGNGGVSTTGNAENVFTFYDGFEDDDIAEYSGNTTLFNTGTDFNYEWTYGLDAVGNETQKTTNGIYQTGTAVSKASTIEYYQYVNAAYTEDEICTLFAVQSSGNNYGVCFELFGTDHVAIVKNVTSNETSGTTLATTNVTWATGWYRTVIDWLSNNTINVTLYTVSTGAEFATVNVTTDSTYSSGGQGFAFWGQHGGWDYYTARQYISTLPSYAFGLEQIDGGATWLSAEDTVLSNQTPGTNLRLRFTVANTGTALTDQTYALEVAPKNAYPNCASIPAVDYDSVTTATGGCGTSPACMYSSSNITDHEATGELLSPPEITAFVAGEMLEDPSAMGNAMDLGVNKHTEMEYNFQLSSVYAVANSYCFRVADDGTDLDSYSEIAEVTLLFPPTISNLKFNNDTPINLTGGATTHITATASTTDFNGYDDFYQATSTFYRSGVSGGVSCVADNNNCYYVASTSCSFSNCADNTCDLSCGADMYFFADPTDEGEFVGQFWNAKVMVEDDSGLTDTESLDGVVVMNTLRALTGTNNVNYGSLNVGSTTEGTNQTVVLTNTGNASVNVVLEGSDLVGPTGSISVSEQKYATSTFTYSSCSICQFLTGNSVQYDVDLPKPTNTAPVTDNLYWGINIPEGTRAETHTGEIRFGVAGV
jgi:nitrate/TMAO reductase-like tetraheme cytochrome c subunit